MILKPWIVILLVVITSLYAETAKVVEVLEVTETAKVVEALEVTEVPKVVEALEVTEPPKVVKELEVTEAPKVAEVLDTTKVAEVIEAPKVAEVLDTTKVVEVLDTTKLEGTVDTMNVVESADTSEMTDAEIDESDNNLEIINWADSLEVPVVVTQKVKAPKKKNVRRNSLSGAIEDEKNETLYKNTREFAVVQKGESRNEHSFELNLMGGIAESVWGYSVGYNKIIAGGYQELHFGLTATPASAEIENDPDVYRLVDPEIMFYSLGGAFRNFYDKIDEGIFWGLGARFSVWDILYTRQGELLSTEKHDYTTTMYLLSELGFLHPLNEDFAIKTNVELGAMFNSQPYEDAGADFRFQKTRPYWNLQIGIAYQI